RSRRDSGAVRFRARGSGPPVASGAEGPRTEEELLADLPPSYVPGVLPRELLPPGERVLFETRASFFGLYWGRASFCVLYLLFFSSVGATSSAAIPGAILFDSPVAIWLAVLVLDARHRVYALTDRRVLRVSGVRSTGFQDAAYGQIRNLAVEPGSSGTVR